MLPLVSDGHAEELGHACADITLSQDYHGKPVIAASPIRLTMSRPSTTLPTTTCLPSHCAAAANVMKNWLSFELAMLTTYGNDHQH